jgi:hypothetical protein
MSSSIRVPISLDIRTYTVAPDGLLPTEILISGGSNWYFLTITPGRLTGARSMCPRPLLRILNGGANVPNLSHLALFDGAAIRCRLQQFCLTRPSLVSVFLGAGGSVDWLKSEPLGDLTLNLNRRRDRP